MGKDRTPRTRRVKPAKPSRLPSNQRAFRKVRVGCAVSANQRAAANRVLERQGMGSDNFSHPIRRGQQIVAYGCELRCKPTERARLIELLTAAAPSLRTVEGATSQERFEKLRAADPQQPAPQPTPQPQPQPKPTKKP